jgi:hypothetical protein
MGAVVFVDFWLAGRFGFRSRYAEASGVSINWAAAVAWVATLVLCLAVVNTGGLQIYFVGLPGWFVAAFLYIVMSRLVQRKEVRS